MTSNPISLEDELQALDKKCRLLLTGEWISLALSGLGTVVTAITNQAVFAATPLTFSLFLNILSRSHQDRRIYDQSSQNLIEVQRQYASQLQGVRSEFLGVDISQNGAEAVSVGSDFEELATKVKQLESFLEIQGGDYYSQGGAVNQEVSILRNHQLEMAEAIEVLTGQIENKGPQLDSNEVQDYLDRLSAAVYELEQKTTALAESNGSQHDIEGLAAKNSDLQGQIEPIQSQLLALEERMNLMATADPAYEPETIQRDMEDLIRPIQTQISSLEASIQEQRSSANAAADLDFENPQLEALQENITGLQVKMDSSISEISADIGDFQQALQNIHAQIDEVTSRIDQVQTQAQDITASSNSAAIEQKIDEINAPLQERLAGIQERLGEINVIREQLDQVRSLAQRAAEGPSHELIQSQVQEATAPLAKQISDVEAQVQAKSANQDFTGQLHQVIEPLQSHMVDLEQRINQLSAEGDRAPLLNKISALQGQLQELEARMAELPTSAEDSSAEIDALNQKVAGMQAHLEQVSQQVSENLAKMPQEIENRVEEKADLLSELQALSFEEEATESKQQARSELDSLLDSLNF